MAKPTGSETVLATNRRASFDYHVLERHEAGVALAGSEVKSIRDGRISLTESWAQFQDGELWLLGAHVAEYVQAHRRNHEPVRRRKLLMHRRELDKLEEALAQQGLTLIPLRVLLRNNRIKIELGLCRGKKAHDKREREREREHQRDIERALGERRR